MELTVSESITANVGMLEGFDMNMNCREQHKQENTWRKKVSLHIQHLFIYLVFPTDLMLYFIGQHFSNKYNIYLLLPKGEQVTPNLLVS